MGYHLSTIDESVRRVIGAAFPAYRGRTVELVPADRCNVASYWEGGSRSYFTFVRLADCATIPVPQQSAFDRQIPGAEAAPIPDGVVCVEHVIFCGKDLGIRIHAPAATLAPMLPAQAELSAVERAVLIATRSFKSSYNGRDRYMMARDNCSRGMAHTAFRDCALDTFPTRDQWDDTKAALASRGLLTKAGAITPAGRNAIA